MKQWFLIESSKQYEEVTKRYEEIHNAQKGTIKHREKLLLAHLINQYEQKEWQDDSLEYDPIELIKIHMDILGYNLTDLAQEYGDKGTISKVLNYKQALSLPMIRKFSKKLHIPVEALIKEYKLKD